jgi:hypothetical protein
MIDLRQYLPAKRKQGASGWISFNAPCCVHNGESADRRQRGGLKINEQGWSFHCFNCGFTASFILGRNIGVKARKFMTWLHVPSEEIERINLESLRHKSIQGILDDRQRIFDTLQGIEFEERELPEGFAIVDQNTPVHYDYLKKRCAPTDYPFGMLCSPPDAKWTGRPGLIVPFTYNGKIVGNTIRYLDDRNPRYVHDTQPGYVFGIDLQQPEWKYVLVMEGVFDALSINGIAVLHADINDTQARLIRSLDKEIIVIPDQDRAGMKLVDRAVELGWSVSMPAWEGCKDVNDAVKKYGRLGTLLTIIHARETSKIKLELRKRQIVKGL